MKKINIVELCKQAEKNWKERGEILALTERLISQEKLTKFVRGVDPSFLRKLWHYPGDLSTTRVVSILRKVMAVKSPTTLKLSSKQKDILFQIIKNFENWPIEDLPHATFLRASKIISYKESKEDEELITSYLSYCYGTGELEPEFGELTNSYGPGNRGGACCKNVKVTKFGLKLLGLTTEQVSAMREKAQLSFDRKSFEKQKQEWLKKRKKEEEEALIEKETARLEARSW